MTIRLEPNARSIAAHVVDRVHREGAFAAAVLDAAVDRYPELDPRERALATELTYGSLRAGPHIEARLSKYAKRGNKIEDTVRAFLIVAGYQILFLDRVPAFAAVSEAVRQVALARGKRVGAFANAVLRRLSEEPAPDKRAALEIAIRESISPDLWSALVRSLGEPAALSALGTGVPPVGLRVRWGEDRDLWVERLRTEEKHGGFEPGAISPLSILMRGGGDPKTLSPYREGKIAIHEEGAQVVALALGASSGETVLDACAGRGNKTALLAEMVGPGGAVDAADQHPAKLARLETELARLQVSARATYAVDWSVGSGDIPGGYDRVLVDAPCSGTGTIRRRPDLASRWDGSKLTEISELQVRILLEAATRAKEGGIILYAVCSLLREEGEEVLERALARAPALSMTPIPGRLPSGVDPGATALRITPHEHGTDGFFMAALRRAGKMG
jgi:16S rRNA (cytosine967-C5)-methyltransferase